MSSETNRTDADADETRVLILDRTIQSALELSQATQRAGRVHVSVGSVADERILRTSAERALDVAVIQVEIGPHGGVVAAYQLLAMRQGLEIVLYSTEAMSAEREAARHLGVPVLGRDALAQWLPDAVLALGQTARARRALRESIDSIPPLPGCTADLLPIGTQRMTPLSEAETRFRQTYLSALLSVAPTRVEAARLAGVPYRTLSQMISKLDIKAPAITTPTTVVNGPKGGR